MSSSRQDPERVAEALLKLCQGFGIVGEGWRARLGRA